MSGVNDRRLEAAHLHAEAQRRRAEGNPSGAFARYRRVLEIADELGDRAWKADLTAEIGQMYQDAYEILEARRWYHAALRLFEELDNSAQRGLTLFKLGQLEQLAGELEQSEQHYRAALELVSAVADRRAEGLTRASLGQLLWERKREAEGVPELVHGLTLLRSVGAPEADHVLEHIRYWRRRIGPVRYRQLIRAATSDPDLQTLLLN